MDFRTEISIPRTNEPIDYSSKIVLLGSCFSDHIGSQLSYYKFQSSSNPLGILFHPLAIEKVITRAIENKKVEENECIQHHDLWHHLDFHSDMSMVNRADLISKVNKHLKALKQVLTDASHIFITLGTAWVYTHKATSIRAANCHKIPQSEFSKSLMNIKEINESLNGIISKIRAINKEAQVIFTLSPVRHLKDGFIENQQSKAHLLTAIHQLLTKKNIHYFPAFEIMLDDLRDYRFYKEDMIHPNNQAIKYIWNKFETAWMNPKVQDLMKEIGSIQQGLAHRPFHPKGKDHERFLKKLDGKILAIKKVIPHLNFK